MHSKFQRFRRRRISAVAVMIFSWAGAVPVGWGGSKEGSGIGTDAAGSEPALSIRFWPGEVELSGQIYSRDAARRLIDRIRNVHPDLEIWDIDLEFDARAGEPPSGDELAGLLLELALSTRDGGLRIAPGKITVTGRTDSLVTQAALSTRLRELSAGRPGIELKNELRVVPSDELMEPAERRPNRVLNPSPLGPIAIAVSAEPYGPELFVPRAIPLDLAVSQADAEADIGGLPVPVEFPEEAGGAAADDDAAAGVDLDIPLGPIAPVRFAPDSFLVEFKQRDTIGEAARTILALPAASPKVTLLGYPDVSGQSTFHEWLALARAKQVRRQLIGFGVPETKLGVERGTDPGSMSQVRIVIPPLR